MASDLDRPDLYVVARFLERLWRDPRSYSRTELQMAVRLNYNVFKKYLEWMLAKELIALHADGTGAERVAITPKGRDTYHRLVEWIKQTVGDHLL